jgi:hypothetical protein
MHHAINAYERNGVKLHPFLSLSTRMSGLLYILSILSSEKESLILLDRSVG